MGNSVPQKSVYGKNIRITDIFLRIAIYVSSFLSVFILLVIIGYVLYRGLPTVNWNFLTTAQSTLQNNFGILPNIINTLYIIVITLLIVTPIGVGSAIYLNEYAKGGKLVRLIEFTTETLAGIPSIIFGLFGSIFFGTVCGLGYSLLTGALTLSLMILPIITRTTQEALKTVPESYKSGALGIGATKWYMIRTILLPSSLNGIITGVILGVGRIVGESAALLFTAGSGFLMPKDFFDHIFTSGGTLTIQMYLSMAKADYDEAFGIALVLIVIVLIINISTKLISRGINKKQGRK